MKLIDAKSNKLYKIENFGNITLEETISFYEQGILEGEIVQVYKHIKTSKNIFIVKIDNIVFSFKKKYAYEIEVKEYNE